APERWLLLTDCCGEVGQQLRRVRRPEIRDRIPARRRGIARDRREAVLFPVVTSKKSLAYFPGSDAILYSAGFARQKGSDQARSSRNSGPSSTETASVSAAIRSAN